MGTLVNFPYRRRWTDAQIDEALARVDQLKADAEKVGAWDRLPLVRQAWQALRDTIERKRHERAT